MDSIQEENTHLSDYEVFKTILTKPREGFRYIHKKNYTNYFYTILFLAGMSSAYEKLSHCNFCCNLICFKQYRQFLSKKDRVIYQIVDL